VYNIIIYYTRKTCTLLSTTTTTTAVGTNNAIQLLLILLNRSNTETLCRGYRHNLLHLSCSCTEVYLRRRVAWAIDLLYTSPTELMLNLTYIVNSKRRNCTHVCVHRFKTKNINCKHCNLMLFLNFVKKKSNWLKYNVSLRSLDVRIILFTRHYTMSYDRVILFCRATFLIFGNFLLNEYHVYSSR